jgi:hypothetical protein
MSVSLSPLQSRCGKRTVVTVIHRESEWNSTNGTLNLSLGSVQRLP